MGVVTLELLEGARHSSLQHIDLNCVHKPADCIQLLYSTLLLLVPIVQLLLAVNELVVGQRMLGLLKVSRLREVVFLELVQAMCRNPRLIGTLLGVLTSWCSELRLAAVQRLFWRAALPDLLIDGVLDVVHLVLENERQRLQVVVVESEDWEL